MIGTGVLHTLLGVLGFRKTLTEIHRARYLDTVGRDPERNAALWYLTTGALLFALGHLARSPEKLTGGVPRSLGWSLLAISVPGVVLLPVSGFWLVLGQALLVLFRARPKPDARTSTQSGARERRILAMMSSQGSEGAGVDIADDS